MKIVDCLIARDVNQVVDLAGDLSKALRQLRHNLNKCEQCDQEGDCQLRAQFQSQITAAITEITEQWNMMPAGNPIHAQFNYE